MHETIWRQGA